MTLSMLLVFGIFILGAASGGGLAYIRRIAVARNIRKQMTEQLETDLYAKSRVEKSDYGYATNSTKESTAIRKVVEQKEMDIAQTRAEIDALHTVIQLLEDPDASPGRYIHTGATASRA